MIVMKNKIISILSVLVMLCVSTDAVALDIKRYVRVGGTGNGTSWENACGSIQKAVDNCKVAGSGTIYVAAGTYHERVTIEGNAHDITIIGGFPAEGGDEQNRFKYSSVIDGKNHYCCISVRHSKNINIDGLVVINGGTGTIPFSEMGTSEAGGIYYNYAEGEITNCEASHCRGYGIYVGDWLNKSCSIRDCEVSYCNRGIYAKQHPVYSCAAHDNEGIGISVSNETIWHSSAYSNKGGGMSVYSGKIAFCYIFNNQNLKGEGGGVRASGLATIYGCEIFNNTAVKGGGIYCGGSDNFGVVACTVVNNKALKEGGGIYTEYKTLHVLSGNILWNNQLANGTFSQFSFVDADHNSVMINSAVQGGGELPETDVQNGIIDVAAGNDVEGKPSVRFAKVCGAVGASATQANLIKEQDFSLLDGSACLRTGRPFGGIAGNGYLMRVNGGEFFDYGINGKKANSGVSNCGAWQLVETQAEDSEANDAESSGSGQDQETSEKTQDAASADIDDREATINYKNSRFSMTYAVNKEETNGEWLVVDITVKNEGEPVKVYGMHTDKGKEFEYVKGFSSITSTKPFVFGTGATKNIKVHIDNKDGITKFEKIRFKFYTKKYTTIEVITINNLKL